MLIAELQRDLSARLKPSASAGVGSLADALTAIIDDPDTFRSLLAEISASRDLLDEVASRSVWHPNGFGKIVLLTGPTHRLRLHVWRRSDGMPGSSRENIHNHRWDFAMVLLAGRYRHQEYRPTSDGEDFHAYAYTSSADKSSYSLTPAGSKPLRCVFEASLSEGSRYTIASEVIHRVIPDPASPPVSLVLEGPPKPCSVEVFALEQVSEPGPAQFSLLSTDYLIDSMKAVMTLPIFGTR
jgi:hypothetical protein